jgi:hypothetical protein
VAITTGNTRGAGWDGDTLLFGMTALVLAAMGAGRRDVFHQK